MKKIFVWLGGVVLLIVGVAGLILPILPGWYFIFAGLCILAPATAFRLKRSLEMKLLNAEVLCFHEWSTLGVDAGMTTRHFPYKLASTQDLADPAKASQFFAQLSKSRAITQQKIDFTGKFVYLNQVHGDRVQVIRGEESAGAELVRLEETDAVITDQKKTTLLVMTADCLPVYFVAVPGGTEADNARATWVGCAHAGWRGTHQKIVQKTLQLLLKHSGAKPEEVYVMFGACAGPKSYEVGPEFKTHFPGKHVKTRLTKHYFDLAGENESQLTSLGVPKKNMRHHAYCTITENRHFYSFRLEKEKAGRMVSFIRLR